MCIRVEFLFTVNHRNLSDQMSQNKGGSSPKLKEGQAEERVPKMLFKDMRAKRQGCEEILDCCLRKFFDVLPNNVMICIFPPHSDRNS